jgi:hypothetical protein
MGPLDFLKFNALGSGLGVDDSGGGGGYMPSSAIDVLGANGGTLPGGGIYQGIPGILGGAGGDVAAGAGGGFAAGLGGPLGVAGLGLSALSSLGSLWMGLKAQKLARKQFKFQKDITNTNLANQIQSYNTALADRARSRGVMEGQTPDQVSGYISANALNRNSGRTGPTSTGTISSAALSNYSNYVRPGSTSAGSVARDEETNG